MRESLTSRNIWVFALAFLACGPVCANEIYRWVDENGVVNFSQTAPPSPDLVTEKVTVQDDRPSDWDPEADIYGVEEQAARMQARREDMEKKRQDRIEQKNREQSLTAPQYREPETYNYPFFWGTGIRPVPPLRPRPPIARPPTEPGGPIRPPGFIIPPRPIDPD